MSKLNIIYNAVAEVTGLDLKKKTRKQPYIFARAYFYYFARENTNCSFAEIGRFVGKNHATVLHGIKIYRMNLNIKREKDVINKIKWSLPDFYEINREIDLIALEMKYLISRNNRLEYQIRQIKTNSFIDEINELPADLKQEFEKYKWLPFKKMLESREHYKMNVEHKPIY